MLLVCAVFLTGSLYEKHFNVPLKVSHGGTCIFEGGCPVSFWRYGMKVREGSYHALYQKTLSEGHSPVQALNFISEGLGDRMFELAASVSVPAVDAQLVVNKEAPFFEYIKEKEGAAVDMGIFGAEVAKALDSGRGAEMVTAPVKAEASVESLVKLTQRRALFSTGFASSSPERKSNIKLALESINGYTLEPGQEFSFNTVVGERKAERGYKEAKIIKNGKFVEGIGGGVCQVSTTLYNAALLSGMTIVSATRHSLPVSYIAPSRDAMVSSGTDFVFRNDTGHPVYIFTRSASNRAEISIFGEHLPAKIELKSELVRTVPFKNKTESDTIIADGELKDYRLIKAGKEGIVSRLYLEQEGKSTLLREDIYAPQDSTWQRIDTETIDYQLAA